jgi:hypothetical protein
VKAVPRQVRADGVALPAEAGAVAVVKIDVEGCEINALLSARKHFAPPAGVAPPELFIELCPYLFERCATTVRDTRVEPLSMAHRFAIAVFDLR